MDYPKLIIYYEPGYQDISGMESLTLSFSRISERDNTYKQKLIMQYRDVGETSNCKTAKAKVTEFHIGATEVIKKIMAIDFDAEYEGDFVDGSEYFLIQFGDKKIKTTDRRSIKGILESFGFDELAAIPYSHYPYIKNVYEHAALTKILDSKLFDLNGTQIKTLSRLLLSGNPYGVFQSMAWLPEYLDDMESQFTRSMDAKKEFD